MKLCPGRSVGAIIKNEFGEYLTLYRKKIPLGLAFPAGHIEENEEPDQAVKREVFEETGLMIIKYNLVLNQIIKNSCSRGYTAHNWFIYEIISHWGVVINKEPDKHEFVKFMKLSDVHSYLEHRNTDPAWEYILRTINLD